MRRRGGPAEHDGRGEGESGEDEGEQRSRRRAEKGWACPHVSVGPGGASSERSGGLLEGVRGALAPERGEEHDDGSVEDQVDEDDSGNPMAEPSERRPRGGRDASRAEEVDDGQDDDQARQEERHEDERPNDRPARPRVAREVDPRGVAERERAEGAEPALDQRVPQRPEVGGLSDHRVEPGETAAPFQPGREEDGDGQ